MERFRYSHADHGHEAAPQPDWDTLVANLQVMYPQVAARIATPDGNLHLPAPLPEIRPVVSSIVKDVDAERQLGILDQLFAQNSIGDVYAHLFTRQGMYQEEAARLITEHERFPQVIETLLPQQGTYRFPLAVLLAHYTTATLPIPWQEKLQSQFVSEDMKASLTEHIPQWFLCGTSENYLIRAMDDEAVTDVNGIMLVKHVGRLAGLCVMNASTPQGSFIRGNWYAPIEQHIREIIRNAHDRGISSLSISGGTWTLMRSVTDYAGIPAEDIVNRAEDCLTSLPDQLPNIIDGYTRAEYRTDYEEAF